MRGREDMRRSRQGGRKGGEVGRGRESRGRGKVKEEGKVKRRKTEEQERM